MGRAISNLEFDISRVAAFIRGGTTRTFADLQDQSTLLEGLDGSFFFLISSSSRRNSSRSGAPDRFGASSLSDAAGRGSENPASAAPSRAIGVKSLRQEISNLKFQI